MPFRDVVGRTSSATVRRLDARSALLELARTDDATAPSPALTLPMPASELPAGAREGDGFPVFVYLDSQDQPVATTRTPLVQRGEVAFLKVIDVTQFGAFVDWGLPKDLLVPFAQQTRELTVGDREPIGLTVDNTGRLTGTMRIRELLFEGGDFKQGEWVEGEAWRNEPEIGLFVILEGMFVGVVPAHEPHGLGRGQAASFRVTQIYPDGRLELSLRGPAHEEIEDDAQLLLAKLSAQGAPKVSDRSSPEQIRSLFGLSKKAFKRAVGRLLKEGNLSFDADGNLVVR